MADYYEIDFLDVESDKSGDAIPLRYEVNGQTYIHVVDGGYQAFGDSLVSHVNSYYGKPKSIDHVVVSHPDGDHAGGLRILLESFEVKALWMLRPWTYAEELLPRFAKFTSVENLRKRLKDLYPNLAALEDIAVKKKIPIYEPFQGASIGAFRVLSPSKTMYLDLVVDSEKTPESVDEAKMSEVDKVLAILKEAAKKVATLIKAAWGAEVFSPNETSAENEMSVVQYAQLSGDKILLTADAGRKALAAAADYAPFVGLVLPGLSKVQVPHHGSRRNVSSELLDRWLGLKLSAMPADGSETFTAFCSSAKKDEHHPRNSVIRGFIHRGAKFYATEGQSLRTHRNAPDREGWSTATKTPYPDEQEE